MMAVLFIILLYGFTVFNDIQRLHLNMDYDYFKVTIVLFVVGMVLVLFRSVFRKLDRSEYRILQIVIMLFSVNASLMFRTIGEKDCYISGLYKDLWVYIIAFFTIYLLIKYTTVLESKHFAYLVMLMLPVILLGTFLGDSVNGAKMTFLNIQSLGLILMGYPFVVAHFFARSDEGMPKYLFGDASLIPWKLVQYLAYSLFLMALAALCNDFTTLFILLIIAAFLFLKHCRLFFIKTGFITTLFLGVILIIRYVPHVRERVAVILGLEQMVANVQDYASVAAASINLYKSLPYTGFWGMGLSTLTKAWLANQHNDYAIFTLIYEYGAFFAVLVILLGVFLVKYLLTIESGTTKYLFYVQRTSGVIVAIIAILHVGSNLGVSLPVGVGFPLVSDGLSFNLVTVFAVAVFCGIRQKQWGLEKGVETICMKKKIKSFIR